MSDEKVGLKWQLDWKSALAIALILPLLLSLGFWQLRRADEKAGLLSQAQTLRAAAPVDVATLQDLENYRPVFARGVFDTERYWLLDNRIFQGRFGYEIIALLKLEGGGELLVDRGWVEGSHDRSVLPAVSFPSGTVLLKGELYRGVGKNYSAGAEVESRWPRRVQWLEIAPLLEEFPGLLSSMLRLDASDSAAFSVKRMTVNISPEKHIGYAVQWFAMAMVLAVIFIVRNSNVLLVLRNRKQRKRL